MKVDAQELWRATKNATLFARPKTWNGGEVEFHFGNGWVTLSASDDFVGILTTVNTQDQLEDPGLKMYLPTASIKQLEKDLRTTEGQVEVELDDATNESKEPEWWQEFELLTHCIGERPMKVQSWECNPERLSMLSRLEPKGKYPLSWLSSKHRDDHFWAFLYGPATVGVVMPLNREDIIDEHRHWMWNL